ncbi:MAG: helix-turn-helix domain-containing protein [Butyrivibrio sp.]|nr:helix-turn-helix domain-containing protein [Muribaculum sp.]MCM1552691.1 helix-turn-helix domain-containing protein [Butyrivibrio sp.]
MIGERLSEIRKDHGDTQAMLAERLNVSLPTIRSWEQEKSSPSHELLISICKLYHVSADYLLGLSDVDPSYVQRNRLEHFNKEELAALRNYEEYLIWKRKSTK